MKHICMTIIFAMVAVTTWAYDEVDGIYYHLSSTDKTAMVTYKTSTAASYTGSVTIPEKVI